MQELPNPGKKQKWSRDWGLWLGLCSLQGGHKENKSDSPVGCHLSAFQGYRYTLQRPVVPFLRFTGEQNKDFAVFFWIYFSDWIIITSSFYINEYTSSKTFLFFLYKLSDFNLLSCPTKVPSQTGHVAKINPMYLWLPLRVVATVQPIGSMKNKIMKKCISI